MDLKTEKIYEYIKAGEKRPEDKTLGAEFEHFIIDANTLKTTSYYGDEGVGHLLEKIGENGYNVHKENGYILNMEKKSVMISTEPGSQFEISIQSAACICTLEKSYRAFFESIYPILEKENKWMVALGYHPKTTIDEIKILPKQRYDFMYQYFADYGGNMAHNMMKGTAASQVTIDFFSEEDFIKKVKVGYSIAPILYTIFDNAYIFEGERYEGHNIRQKIWENTDKDRSGIPDIVFDEDFGYQKYAEYILKTPVIFMDHDHQLTYEKNRTIREVFDPSIHGEDEIYHFLSIVFPDLRIKRYLEFRMMDSVPYPLNFSMIALIKGIFYCSDNLDLLQKRYQSMNYQKILEIKENVEKDSLKGQFLDTTVVEEAKYLVELAKKGLSEREQEYLKPLEQLLMAEETPKDIFAHLYDVYGLEAAVENFRIKL